MDYSTLLYVWDAFSFILFLVILLSTIHEKENLKDNYRLVVTSFLMFTGLFLFYREQYQLSLGNEVRVISFFTYFMSTTAHMSIVLLITNIYIKGEFTRKIYIGLLIYGLVSGVIMEVDARIGTFVSKHLLLGVINVIPQTHLFFVIIFRDKKFYRNIFFYQVILLLLIYVAKTIHIFTFPATMTFVNAPRLDAGLLMLANVIIYNYFISYLLVKGIKTNKELEQHRNIIEASLLDAVKLSEIDSLTNIYNRRKIDQLLSEFDEYGKSSGFVYSILILDIDDFKEINDTFGHSIGDEVLRFVSNSLKVCLRMGDVISRWGGDEFLVILPNTNEEKARYVVNKLYSYFESNEVASIGSSTSLSIGVCDNSNNVSVSEMIQIADKRMYEEKKK